MVNNYELVVVEVMCVVEWVNDLKLVQCLFEVIEQMYQDVDVLCFIDDEIVSGVICC